MTSSESTIISLAGALERLPPVPKDSLLPQIRAQLAESGRKIVVLDDDPTGTQTVHDTPVLTRWDTEALAAEFSKQGSLFYILTNSRSLPTEQAVALADQIGGNLSAASERTGKSFVVVSRGDSTLRGHYPAEVDALAASIGKTDALQIVMPFFLQGGRYTIDDVHYVADGDNLVPAGDTPFARDATFGFQASDLCDWVMEKRGPDFPSSRVHSISLAELRTGSGDALAKRLNELPGGDVCVVNATCMRDVEAFVMAALSVEQSGKSLIYRTAASFVQAFAGLQPQPLLERDDLIDPSVAAGLIVVGSYVPKTTAQLRTLSDHAGDLVPVTLDVNELLSDRREAHLAVAKRTLQHNLLAGHHVVLQTTRAVVTGDDAQASLRIGNRISDAIVELVGSIDHPLRFLIAKGGITSSDVATKGLDVDRAIVAGQILPGVPVWRLGGRSRMPGLAYVVFPGNVGDDDGLLRAYEKLR